MESKEIMDLIDKIASKENLSTVEIENNGFRLTVTKDRSAVPFEVTVPPVVGKPEAGASVEINEVPPIADDILCFTNTKLVKSPLVGTFYTAPSEDAEPYVKPGDTVKKGQTIAVVEAMKLLNEIECEFDGTLEAVLVKNGELVEYGQTLFRILER